MQLKLLRIFSSFKMYLQTNFGTKEKIITVILLVVILLLILFQLVYKDSTTFYRLGKREATVIAKKYGEINEVLDFYYFNRGETFFSVKGRNKKNELIYVVMPQNGNNAYVLKEKDGLSDNEALKKGLEEKNVKQINKIGLGKYKNDIVWELTAKNKKDELVYYYYDFKNGKLVHEFVVE